MTISAEERDTIAARDSEILRLAREGIPPMEIARRICLPAANVSNVLWRARDRGEVVPRFRSARFRGVAARAPRQHVVSAERVKIASWALDLLEVPANIRGVSFDRAGAPDRRDGRRIKSRQRRARRWHPGGGGMTLGSHQSTVGKSQTHFTPRNIIEALGPFDLDPCAGDPRPWDCAATNYIEADDGLSRGWLGRVWLNPPFNRYDVGRWIQRLADHGQGTALLHARTETAWFRPIWRKASAILFLADRVIFFKADGSPQTISDPASKHFGKPANSGAPVVLAAFGAADAARLRTCGLAGEIVTAWHSVACFAKAAE